MDLYTGMIVLGVVCVCILIAICLYSIWEHWSKK